MTEETSANVTVLVVEDEVFIRMVIADYLRGCGYDVIEAANADEAVIVLEHPQLEVDVVFSDLEMPGTMSGFELAHWIRKHRPGIDVILTGNADRAVDSAAELCESGPLPKPYEPKAAVDRIRRLMALRAGREKN